MVKLKTIWRTLTVARNPVAVLSLKREKNRKTLTLRNGITFQLTWPQFRVMRDNYDSMRKYSITQIDDNLFKIANKKSEVNCDVELFPIILDLMDDFIIHQEEKNFHLKNEKIELQGSLAMLICLRELRTGEYDVDVNGKVVLDVGGFEGESAAYFWSRGAKKILIYEPVPSHVEFIRKNVALNSIVAEIYESGIGNRNSTQKITYDETDPGFGVLSTGLKTMEIAVTDVSKVISESKATVGKFDCEGAEESLVSVPIEILQKIQHYIIEVHSFNIRNRIIEKFLKAGFCLEKEIRKTGEFSVLRFRKKIN